MTIAFNPRNILCLPRSGYGGVDFHDGIQHRQRPRSVFNPAPPDKSCEIPSPYPTLVPMIGQHGDFPDAVPPMQARMVIDREMVPGGNGIVRLHHEMIARDSPHRTASAAGHMPPDHLTPTDARGRYHGSDPIREARG
jgi:hypothetical protein